MGKINKEVRAHKKDIVDCYTNGTSAYKISVQYNCTIQLIQKIIKENGGRVRGNMEAMQAKRTHSVNKHCFDVLTDETAYWLGMLLTDGYVSSNKSTLELALKDTDIAHVTKFRDFVGSNKPIKIKLNNRGYNSKNENYLAVATVNCGELLEKLKMFNIIHRKTYTAECPDVLLNNRHFWRGCIDGDGFIGKNSKGIFDIGLYGTKRLCEQFADFVRKELNDESLSATVFSRPSVHLVKFSKHSVLIELAKLLYQDSHVYLARKKSTVDELLVHVKPTVIVHINVYDRHRNFIECIATQVACANKYKIKPNTINSAMLRGTLCQDKYYFERNPQILDYIRS